MKYLNLDGVSKLWEKSVAKFALKSHIHPVATASDNGFLSKYDKLKLDHLENTNYPHDNLLYDTNYYAPSQTDSAGIYERYISTTAGNDSSETTKRVYNHLMGVKVTLSIEARNTSESSGLITTPVADDRLPPSPSIMGARLAVYQTGNDTPIYTLDVPITTDDALQLTSDYKRFYATGTLPDAQIDKIRVYYGVNCKTTTAGILAVRRPKLELGSQGTEWVQDNLGLIDAGAKKVNKSGDTMTGNLNIRGTYYPSFKLIPTNTTYGQKNLVFEGSYVGEASMGVWDTTDGKNRRLLVLRGANYQNTNGTYTMDNALVLRVAVNDNWTGYRVFHEGITTPIPIANGGTGATTAAQALTNLGAFPSSGGTLTGAIFVNGYVKGARFCVNGTNDYPTYEFKAKSQTDYGCMMQTGSTNMFGIYEYPKEFDGQSTRYYEGYVLPEPSTGLTQNQVYRILTTKTVIYSASQPSNPSTGTIWLKPV